MKVKTTPENVKEANMGLFRAKMNLPEAAAHCGMTQKEMKMTFLEFLKYKRLNISLFLSVQPAHHRVDGALFVHDRCLANFQSLCLTALPSFVKIILTITYLKVF